MSFGQSRKSDSVNRTLIGAALLVMSFYLLTEHRAHLFGALPYLLLLACLFIHLFMHRGHGTVTVDGQDKAQKNCHGKEAPHE